MQVISQGAPKDFFVTCKDGTVTLSFTTDDAQHHFQWPDVLEELLEAANRFREVHDLMCRIADYRQGVV